MLNLSTFRAFKVEKMDYDTLITYLEAKPTARRDMPFGADTLVFKVLDRMFALVAWQAEPLTINLKVDPVDAVILRKQYKAVKGGYHMNKKHWNTVTLDGSIPDEEIRKMIDESYTLVVQGMTRAKQARLRRMGWMEDEA
jgi:predicted DNA-binding protein (MmcQ/YjbR family)